ncbi:solute carrier family 2, facilitated glucose transporter member 7 isoform X1 [Psammomys obesus]|uniref:solute carrier family 2, facilitated glucose transporter member 7 isoform X1 n=3 Tax=Psammomys obesus TaxID=48139 RepID=UPI00245366A5|nr:solute carrier family 2, facilitated glucose transporter member 7 isoform X1 [Psammomys obesus]
MRTENKGTGTPLPMPNLEGRLQPTLALATLSASFGSVFQYGYNISVINTPHKVMKSFYNDTYFERHGTFMDENTLLLLWSCTVSMFPLGGVLGSLIVGLMVNKWGRKGTLLINNVFAITSAILMGASKVARSFELIILSRVLVGICAGISYSALPMYLGELAPRNLRGTLGTMTEVFSVVGILLGQIFSLQAILGNATGWPILLALTGVPALIQLFSLPFFPESPRYTLIEKGDEDAARQALRRLRGHSYDVEAEMEEMRTEERTEQAEGRLSVFNLFTFRPLRWQLISIIVLMAGQQLSGINSVHYYADIIYTSAGVDPTKSQYVTVGAGLICLVMTLISAVAVERLGRRILLLSGYAICISASLVLTTVLLLQSTVPELSYLAIVCVFTYIVGHAIGPSTVPSVLRTEIVLQSSRTAALTVDGAVHWFSNFIMGLAFPSIQVAIGAYSFLIFAALCLLTAAYIYVVIPETKGRTFVEINCAFAKRNGIEFPQEKEGTTAKPHPPSLHAKETSF